MSALLYKKIKTTNEEAELYLFLMQQWNRVQHDFTIETFNYPATEKEYEGLVRLGFLLKTPQGKYRLNKPYVMQLFEQSLNN